MEFSFFMNAIWLYFCMRYHTQDMSIGTDRFEARGFFEMIFKDRICTTLRVYFNEDHVKMVWLAWGLTNDGRTYEYETDAMKELSYDDFATTRAEALVEFREFATECNAAAVKRLELEEPGLFRIMNEIADRKHASRGELQK